MARKAYTAEQIIGILREAAARLAKSEKIGAHAGSRSLPTAELHSLSHADLRVHSRQRR